MHHMPPYQPCRDLQHASQHKWTTTPNPCTGKACNNDLVLCVINCTCSGVGTSQLVAGLRCVTHWSICIAVMAVSTLVSLHPAVSPGNLHQYRGISLAARGEGLVDGWGTSTSVHSIPHSGYHSTPHPDTMNIIADPQGPKCKSTQTDVKSISLSTGQLTG